MENKYCILGFEDNEPMKMFQAWTEDGLVTTDDWDYVKYFDNLTTAKEVKSYLQDEFNDYTWYVLICNE